MAEFSDAARIIREAYFAHKRAHPESEPLTPLQERMQSGPAGLEQAERERVIEVLEPLEAVHAQINDPRTERAGFTLVAMDALRLARTALDDVVVLLADLRHTAGVRAEESAKAAAERERCAQIADRLGDNDKNEMLNNESPAFTHGYETAAREIAAAIRSLK